MTAVQLAFDCEPDWQPVVVPRPRRGRRLKASEQHDLRAHGLTPRQLRHMTTIRVPPEYL